MRVNLCVMGMSCVRGSRWVSSRSSLPTISKPSRQWGTSPRTPSNSRTPIRGVPSKKQEFHLHICVAFWVVWSPSACLSLLFPDTYLSLSLYIYIYNICIYIHLWFHPGCGGATVLLHRQPPGGLLDFGYWYVMICLNVIISNSNSNSYHKHHSDTMMYLVSSSRPRPSSILAIFYPPLK